MHDFELERNHEKLFYSRLDSAVSDGLRERYVSEALLTWHHRQRKALLHLPCRLSRLSKQHGMQA